MAGSARTKRFGLTAELRDRPGAADAYERYHADIWPEVIADGRLAGVIRTAIFRDGTTLFMVMDAEDSFDIDAFGLQPSHPRTDEWQRVMDSLLSDQPGMGEGRKWRVIGTVCDVA